MSKRTAGLAALFLALLWAAPQPAAQEEAPKPRRAVVTLEGKLEALPSLTPADFEIEAGKQKLQPARLYGPDQLPTLIAVVLQENQTQEFGTQLPALRDFILGQPPKTYVGVFYLSVEAVETAIMFDSNLSKVADTLRVPKGMQDLAPPTPYLLVGSIVQFMDKLPAARKEVLWFSDGSDALAGDATAGQNRNLQVATRAAQEAGIPIWVMYSEAFPPRARLQRAVGEDVAGAGPPPSTTPTVRTTQEQLFGAGAGAETLERSSFEPSVQYGTSYLNYLAERSGGKVFSAGKVAPDMAPFLKEFQELLGQQFVLEFASEETPKKVKLLRKIRGAKLLHPKR